MQRLVHYFAGGGNKQGTRLPHTNPLLVQMWPGPGGAGLQDRLRIAAYIPSEFQVGWRTAAG